MIYFLCIQLMTGAAVKREFKTKDTIRACFAGYVVQAAVNNFVPLLFVTFSSEFGLSLSKITLLITFNFCMQLISDLASAPIVRLIGVRRSAVAAHLFASAGLIMLTFLPDIMPNPLAGLLISVSVYAVGGGLLEVLISPIVESCPTGSKESAMSMLHSFYCWGHVGVVVLSTVFFLVFGSSQWRWLALFWAILPLVNAFYFLRVPLYPFVPEGVREMSYGDLFRNGRFWLIMVLMVCAGASEQAVSQWASAFAEEGLGVTKAVGDLAGPAFFALMMGSSRAIYGKHGSRMPLPTVMIAGSALCIASYLLIYLSPVPVVSLIGCGICGFSVGIMWPGTFSIAARVLPGGGARMYSILALCGDLGCCAGPTFVGFISSSLGGELGKGIVLSVGFPIIMLIGSAAAGKLYKDSTLNR
ncbi:MAG: MFS transporter [Oscillospiraceae bacterium]